MKRVDFRHNTPRYGSGEKLSGKPGFGMQLPITGRLLEPSINIITDTLTCSNASSGRKTNLRLL